MKQDFLKVMAFLWVIGLVCVGHAKTVYWGGATSGNWTVGGGGWLDEAGHATTFEDGDDVMLTNATGTVVLKAGGFFSVGHLVVDASNTYRLNAVSSGPNNQAITNMLSFTKRGTGSFQFYGGGGTYTNDIVILEGRLENSQTKDYPASNFVWTAYGNATVPRTIRIGDGTGTSDNYPSIRLTNYGSCVSPLGPFTSKPSVKLVIDAGQLVHGNAVALGDVDLLHGGMIGNPGSNLNLGSYHALNGKVSVLRSPIEEGEDFFPPAIVYSAYYEGQDRGMCTNLETGEPTEFYVEELSSLDETDDGITDFILCVCFRDYPVDSETISKGTWRKTGPGTLTITKNEKTFLGSIDNTFYSRHTGDIFIDEGRVRVDAAVKGGVEWSPLGDLKVERSIFVNAGAELELVANTVLGRSNSDSLVATIVVSNGTYKIDNQSQYRDNHTANVHVKGSGVFTYNNLGKYRFGGKMVFETDSPTNLPPSNTTYLDCRIDQVTEPVSETVMNRFGYTEFRVASTPDNAMNGADLTVEAKFLKHDNPNWFTGLKKTGEGVLTLTQKNTYNYDTKVTEGGLYLASGSEVASDAVVEANGALGGAGTVKGDVMVEVGGGLLVDATDPTAQLTVQGDYSLPVESSLQVFGYTGDLQAIAETVTGVPLPAVQGTATGLDVLDTSAWKVTVKGYEPKACRNLKVVQEADGTLTVKWSPSGTRLIVL